SSPAISRTGSAGRPPRSGSGGKVGASASSRSVHGIRPASFANGWRRSIWFSRRERNRSSAWAAALSTATRRLRIGGLKLQENSGQHSQILQLHHTSTGQKSLHFLHQMSSSGATNNH